MIMRKQQSKEFTEAEFDKLCKEDKSFKKAYNDWLVFESWLAMQGAGLRREVDDKCKEYVRQLNKTEE